MSGQKLSFDGGEDGRSVRSAGIFVFETGTVLFLADISGDGGSDLDLRSSFLQEF